MTKYDRYNASAKGKARADRYEETEHGRWMRDTYEESMIRQARRRSAADAAADWLAARVGQVLPVLAPMFEPDYLKRLWSTRMTRAIVDQRKANGDEPPETCPSLLDWVLR
jgi:hypothetical protein